jgi:hypothetical protein
VFEVSGHTRGSKLGMEALGVDMTDSSHEVDVDPFGRQPHSGIGCRATRLAKNPRGRIRISAQRHLHPGHDVIDNITDNEGALGVSHPRAAHAVAISQPTATLLVTRSRLTRRLTPSEFSKT